MKDKTLFERIYNQMSGKLYMYAMRITAGDTYLSEEILQICFMQLWEHLDSIRDYTKMEQYLYATAKHTFLNYCEHDVVKYMYMNYMLEHGKEADESAESRQDAVFLEAYLKEIIGKMPPMRQKVFVLSRYKHLSNKEIASKLGISEKTVEVHITLALKQLKETLNKNWD